MAPGELARPPRVLVVSQYRAVGVGGAERYIDEVCRRLERQHGFVLHHLAADLPAELSPARWHFASTGMHPRWPGEVARVLREWRPDALYVHHTVPGLTDIAVRAARRLRVPVALMYHSDVTGPGPVQRMLGTLYQRLLGDGSLAAADEVQVGTRGYVEYSSALRRLGRPVVEAPPGVDGVMAGGVRRPGGRYLLFVGKPDVPSKGFGALLRAWQHLRLEEPDLELAVIGAAPPRETPPGLRWVGLVASRRELADWYASALLTVLPSTSSAESFGMVLAEALLAGCPVVGSRVGGIPSLIEEGQTGYLAAPGDTASLLRALRAGVRHHPTLQAGVNARRGEYLTRFSWNRTADIVARSLRGLAARRTLPEGQGWPATAWPGRPL
ncbi:glycosyltransferase family 4 protein [Deinococcus apachensis]|uniref:glycosyltransferase family 4 protein n=1 Tax=Deinococcus apachensis TaxID=309886 RepID=UPI0003A1542C|nr:glycosyltransferase family 4 protein [Deinococcus apachensis]